MDSWERVKTSGDGFVRMMEGAWYLGLSSGSVFLPKNWLRCDEKVFRVGKLLACHLYP